MGSRLLFLLAVCCHLVAENRVESIEGDSQATYTCLSRPVIVGGDSAPTSDWGRVSVVSLIQAGSDYSRRQAELLNELRLSLTSHVNSGSHVGLDVIGINSRHWSAKLMISELSSKVNFSVYQSTRRNDLWSRLGGHKDDVFVYDRWGNLAYYVPFPYSYVPSRYVEAAVLSAMNDGPCTNWPTVVMLPVNCSNSTNGANNTENSDIVDEDCTSYDEQRWSSLTSDQRQSRRAVRCWQRLQTSGHRPAGHRQHHQHHQRRQHNRHQHRHQITSNRCLWLPMSPGGLRHWLCRSLAASSSPAQSNCFCTMTASQIENQCTWQQVDWTSTSADVNVCSWPAESLQSSPSWSWQEPPSPHGQFTDLSESTIGYCRPHGQPLIWPQATWRWPLTSADGTTPTASWSWHMELGANHQHSSGEGQNSEHQLSAVRWMWPQRDGVRLASDKTWSWQETASVVGQVNSWNVSGWECSQAVAGSDAVIWASGRPWRDADEAMQQVECRWQGQRVDRVVWWSNTEAIVQWNNDAEWRRQQQAKDEWNVQWRLPWGSWLPPERAWQTDWQLVEWSWTSGEAASTLWRQASSVSWSRHSWQTVAGWSWKDAPRPDSLRRSRQRTTGNNEWSLEGRHSWVTVNGWRWRNNRLVFDRWQNDGGQQAWSGGGVQWSSSSVAQWAWGQRRGTSE